MTWPYSSSDCQCVTGIEKFIDPRPYLPQYESPDSNEIELPVWEQNRQAAEKKRQEELAAQSAQTTAEISPERILKLVVQRTILTNQEYVKLLAHQINSFYVQLDSLDEAWRNRDVSIIFQHAASGRQAMVPVIKLGKPVPIPADILLPGLVKCSAIAVARTGDYSVITTEALDLRVYDTGIRPIDWPKLKSYDVYFLYQTMVKNLQADFDELSKSTPTVYATEIPVKIHDTTKNEDIPDIEIPWKFSVTELNVVGAEVVMEIEGLDPESGYTLSFKFPYSDVVDDLDYSSVVKKYADCIIANDSVSGSALQEAESVDISTVHIDLSAYPTVNIEIPEGLNVDTVKLKFDEVKLDR